MIAVILAAGEGTRLRPITDTIPKCMIIVGGVPILHHQLDAYYKAGIRKVIVVTGYLSEKIRDYVSKLPPNFLDIQLVENLNFASTNNMYSLWLTHDLIDDDILLSNGDVIFDPKIIVLIAKAKQQNLVASDRSQYLEESMKIIVRDGIVTKISKTITPNDAYATSIDLYRLGKKTAHELFSIIETRYIAQNKLNQWTEVALQDLFAVENFEPFDIDGRHWIEIDTPSDLQEAECLFGN